MAQGRGEGEAVLSSCPWEKVRLGDEGKFAPDTPTAPRSRLPVSLPPSEGYWPEGGGEGQDLPFREDLSLFLTFSQTPAEGWSCQRTPPPQFLPAWTPGDSKCPALTTLRTPPPVPREAALPGRGGQEWTAQSFLGIAILAQEVLVETRPKPAAVALILVLILKDTSQKGKSQPESLDP